MPKDADEQGLHQSIEAEQEKRASDEHCYKMTISRRTVDKLGVKLNDRASAVVAELVANACDADAAEVRVKLPLATLLGNSATEAKKTEQVEEHAEEVGSQNGQELVGHVQSGRVEDELSINHRELVDGFDEESSVDASSSEHAEFIELIDDGHGMDPKEADTHFLTVGQDRRITPSQGAFSRDKRRAVTGRKGIGKLAPFGICSRMEVVSAGGQETQNGYLTSHFILDYAEIIQDTEEPYYPKRGENDRTFTPESGTTIRLSKFQKKRVPDQETFLRQLARRFGAEQKGFQIVVQDTKDPDKTQRRQ